MATPTPTSVRADTPHLSHSRINRYLTCPESYRLHYVEGLRLRHPSANLAFGKVLHDALAGLFGRGEDPVAMFVQSWEQFRDETLTYSGRSDWHALLESGRALLERFASGSLERITNVSAVEQRFELRITGIELPFIGFVDLVAELDGKKSLIDFKTASARYGAHEVEMSDQLTAYQMAEPDAEQTALCVLVKTKTPQVAWQVASRRGTHLAEYLAKAKLVEQAILRAEFYKRPGPWCRWCDFLPVCAGDQAAANATLIKIR